MIEYETLRVSGDGGVVIVTIDHPPLNLLDGPLTADLTALGRALRDDAEAKVAVFRSADPDFFIAHADLGTIDRLRQDPPPPGEGLLGFHRFIERWRTHRVITIAEIDGIARGGGSELALSFDMRFASRGRARFAQPEVALGIIPGGGATQRLAHLAGRSRALEIVLGGDDFDAATAERYGWINRALPDAELRPFVDALARRVASMPAHALEAAKRAVLAAQPDPAPGLRREGELFFEALAHPETAARLARARELGIETRDGEVELASWLPDLEARGAGED
jgi:enoyl-CoA hydratase/carnithine racemase